MPINCKDFLTFAEECLDRNDEIGYRNAISRAYYCSYHAIKSVINFEPPKNQPSHESVIKYLSSPAKDEKIPNTTLRSLGFRLAVQKKLRSRSDYCLDETIYEQEALDFLKNVNTFIQDIEKHIILPNDSVPNPQP